jgi:hypothetical protein
MKIKYETIKAGELKVGDLFANATQEVLEKMIENEAGVGIFIRTDKEIAQIEGRDAEVRRITIVKEKKKSSKPKKGLKVPQPLSEVTGTL